MKRQGGRPVLDAMKKREILAVLTLGGSRRIAAKYVGCAVSTIQNAANRDPEFAEALERAESNLAVRCLTKIDKAADKEQYWRAAAWALERRYPREFASEQADKISAERMRHLLAQLAEIIVAEVPVARFRKNVLKRLASLTGAVSSPDQATGRGDSEEPEACQVNNGATETEVNQPPSNP